MPHILAISSLSLLYFSVFPTFLLFTRSSPGMARSTILTSFLVLSITTKSGRRVSILISHWIVKSHRILYPLLSITPSGSCFYHCCAPRKPYFSHSFQWMYLHTLSCLFLYSFWANILHSLTICDTVSFSTLHILQRGDSPVLFLWNFT